MSADNVRTPGEEDDPDDGDDDLFELLLDTDELAAFKDGTELEIEEDTEEEEEDEGSQEWGASNPLSFWILIWGLPALTFFGLGMLWIFKLYF